MGSTTPLRYRSTEYCLSAWPSRSDEKNTARLSPLVRSSNRTTRTPTTLKRAISISRYGQSRERCSESFTTRRCAERAAEMPSSLPTTTATTHATMNQTANGETSTLPTTSKGTHTKAHQQRAKNAPGASQLRCWRLATSATTTSATAPGRLTQRVPLLSIESSKTIPIAQAIAKAVHTFQRSRRWRYPLDCTSA